MIFRSLPAPLSNPTPKWFSLLREMLTIMLCHPWLLAAAIAPNVIKPAIDPIQAWLAREVLDEVAKGERLFHVNELLSYAPWAVAIFFGLGLLQLIEKITNRMLDDRLLISLQRTWFDRRGRGCVGAQVAQAMNDCENARKILDLFQKELWLVIIGLPAVIIWQLSLAPELLPALLIASILPFFAALLFGRLIQHYSHNVLRLVSKVGSAVATGDKQQLYQQQEGFYRNRIRFELWKQASEVTADFAYWLSLVLILVLTSTGIIPLLPEEVTAAQIGVFLVNLKLMNKPLSEITKVYNKWREGWPAVERTLRPQEINNES
jgi:ABC-type multidrug transport system fused ATPase/permease subunit